MQLPEAEPPKHEMTACIHCGSKVVRQARADGIPAWNCLSWGREYLDGATAALNNAVYRSNEVRLYTDGKEICAMTGPDPVQGIAGYGSSVHEALRDLADQLVTCGVRIEVTDINHPFNWSESPKPDE
ncbi:MAG: hypothetical protein ACLQU1_12465 [Bryobacteraceae bacterium]